ncbi:MAG: hypothetical protein KJ888_20515 [Gammaproteobacteria bacterium]|uniref:Uncharacterized protein n=1 Tax=viral metagenome TaxID=1070528 RepID=A0A6M3L2L0_9ZZZZ|nr:hypothetical protein [Gammaproteobacteria bacterium]
MADEWFENETRKHQQEVQRLLILAAKLLLDRAVFHDQSKLEPPEREIFIEYTPKLREVTYGSEEYKAYLKEMQIALEHHYAKSPHHPEYNIINGLNNPGFEVDGMNLIDVIEMLCDWIAATKRHADGSIGKSIDHNQKRFQISDQLTQILRQTVGYLNSAK